MKRKTIDIEKAKRDYEFVVNKNEYLTEKEKVGAHHLAFLLGLINQEEYDRRLYGKEQP